MPPKNAKLRSYFCKAHKDEYWGISFVAYTARAAKLFAFKSGELDPDLENFIDITVSWQKDVNVKDLKEGQSISIMEGLKRGCYNCSGEVELKCPICRKETILYGENGKAGCYECLYGRIKV
jgi:hypothetical protein